MITYNYLILVAVTQYFKSSSEEVKLKTASGRTNSSFGGGAFRSTVRSF